MDGFTDSAKQEQGFSLATFLLSIFNLELRDKLSDQQSEQDEGAYTWGL